mmetsp:Transcript_8633/g.21242  ORF Transcript_8633/g.21242 Transcript_8633/m.21242 type:complete len:147 (+) Transcript_8633:1775-2215(+)
MDELSRPPQRSVTIGFYPQDYTSLRGTILSNFNPLSGLLITPDPITESFRRRARRQGAESSERTIISGRLDSGQSQCLRDLIRLDEMKVVTRREGETVEAIFPVTRRYKMVPFFGEGDNCCTFLEDIFPIASLLGIPYTAYPQKHS